MNIPIQNIYYMLCYAWDKLAERDVVDVEAIDSATLADLFSKVLVSGSNHLLRRGFDRGYVCEREWTSRLRGRVLLSEVIARGPRHSTTLPCEFDELSYNVLHNQILKSTVCRLVHVRDLAKESVEDLLDLRRRLEHIEEIELNARAFGRVQLHRNNQFYEFLMRVCELLYRNLLAAEGAGASRFMDFVRDEKQMASLFEGFVRKFYGTHSSYSVKREDIYWRWQAVDEASDDVLPKMQTDVSLTTATRKIIIDCKYTPEATKRHYEAEKLRSGHLYQMFAYLNNLPPGKLSDSCEVMLLYPTVDAPIRYGYTDSGRTISIRSINLNQPWQGIHDDLLALVA